MLLDRHPNDDGPRQPSDLITLRSAARALPQRHLAWLLDNTTFTVDDDGNQLVWPLPCQRACPCAGHLLINESPTGTPATSDPYPSKTTPRAARLRRA
jgi:hypothetical protein